jgi:hypothetical protein
VRWLESSVDPPPTLWEGRLAIVESDIVERYKGEQPGVGQVTAPRELPSVSVGQPQVWPLVELFEEETVPAMIRQRLADHDYYLVRLSCSFRVRPNDLEIEWARFSIALETDHTGRQPLAVDLHPMTVAHKVQRDVKVALKPSLKFGPVTVGGLEAGVGLQYTLLEPEVSAAGVGEPTASWDYQATKITPLRGSKCMHLLVEAPTGMTAGEATINLDADLLHGGHRLPAILRRREADQAEPFKTSLWG